MEQRNNRSRPIPTDSTVFQRKYWEQTGRIWTGELTKLVQMYLELQHKVATIAEQYIGSGRYKKEDSIRVHFIKEVALQGITCGKDLPSEEDLAILRLPLAKSLSASQSKAVISWGVTKTRSETVVTEAALQTVMRQTTMLQFCVTGGQHSAAASVGGKTSVTSGLAAEYKIDVGQKYLGKTIREVAALNTNYVAWLCSDEYVWRFPKNLNLFYGLYVYLDTFENKNPGNPILSEKAFAAFLSYWQTTLPGAFGDLDEVNDDDLQRIAGDEAGVDGDDEDEDGGEPGANVNDAPSSSSTRRIQQTNNVTKASIRYFKDVILSTRKTPQSRMQQVYTFNPTL